MRKMSRNALTLVAGLIAFAVPGQQAHAQLVQVLSETGKIFLSVDGLGTTGGTGTIDVLKPSTNATVRTARFICATVGSFVIPDGGVTINGVGVTWSITVPSSINFNNQLADVTAQMAAALNPASAGLTAFTIVENEPLKIDGCTLAVIFDDPAETLDHTAILLFGAQSTGGDTFNISLGTAIDLSNPNLVLDFGLAISFSGQDQPPKFGGSNLCGENNAMNSEVEVNGVRLTSCAGNLDDAPTTETVANGNLYTVGGLGDSNANPVSPLLAAPQAPPSFVDDELYDLIPFVSDGDTTITVFTINPSNDDNIHVAYLFTLGPAVLAPFTTSTSVAVGPCQLSGSALTEFNSQCLVNGNGLLLSRDSEGGISGCECPGVISFVCKDGTADPCVGDPSQSLTDVDTATWVIMGSGPGTHQFFLYCPAGTSADAECKKYFFPHF